MPGRALPGFFMARRHFSLHFVPHPSDSSPRRNIVTRLAFSPYSCVDHRTAVADAAW
jgi:hypothetical protein